MAKLIHYSGDVQGVGFSRESDCHRERHAVRGWVRNLSDGRVELFVDGEPDAITSFLAEVRNQMLGLIDNEDTSEREPDPKLEGFRIWY